MTGLLEALRPVIALLLGVLLELFQRRARPTAVDADPDTAVRDRLREKVRKHWMLVPLAILLLPGCGVRTVYVPHGTPVRLRETVKDAKVWVKDDHGEVVPGHMTLYEGWYCLEMEPHSQE